MLRTRLDSSEGHIVTRDLRIFGRLHSLPGASIADLLNRTDRPVLPVTEPMVYRRGKEFPPPIEDFLAAPPYWAVPKHKVLWAVGNTPPPAAPPGHTSRRMGIVFGTTLMRGKLWVPHRGRTTDFIATRLDKRPFELVYGVGACELGPKEPLEALTPFESFDAVAVNLGEADGVIELAGAEG